MQSCFGQREGDFSGRQKERRAAQKYDRGKEVIGRSKRYLRIVARYALSRGATFLFIKKTADFLTQTI